MKDLITEARELCEGATSGKWKRHDTADYAEIHNGDTWGKNLNPIALVGHTDDANFIARSRTLIPELCDALEKGEAELIHYHHLQKVTEGQMKQNQRLRRQLEKAEEKNKQLLHEVCKLACESVERDCALAKLEAEVDRLSQLAMMRESEIGDKDREIERMREALEIATRGYVNCNSAERQSDGKCLGYGRGQDDDEPCCQCKGCPINTAYEPEEGGTT